MMLHTKYQGSRPCGFRQEDFFEGGGHFWPQGYNLNKLGRSPLSDATYQISKLSEKIFSCCSLYKPM